MPQVPNLEAGTVSAAVSSESLTVGLHHVGRQWCIAQPIHWSESPFMAHPSAENSVKAPSPQPFRRSSAYERVPAQSTVPITRLTFGTIRQRFRDGSYTCHRPFGEQGTKKFLSELTAIFDGIIFAIDHLGIITAVASRNGVANSACLKPDT
jgi:hypothetical protein